MSAVENFGRDLTALVITHDEEANLHRTLSKLTWVKSVLVVDSGSRDRTLEIAAGFPNVSLLTRDFDTFAGQCNFGLENVKTEWVLSLDADYVLSDELVAELTNIRPEPTVAGYRARFIYAVWGQPLRGTLYPPRVVLYRHRLGKYLDEGHGHRLCIEGRVVSLLAPILHDDRKSLTRWVQSQRNYAWREVAHLLTAAPGELGKIDRLRLKGWIAPLLILPYVLIGKGCIFDGRAGWFYALQRLFAEVSIALELLDQVALGKERKVNPREPEQKRPSEAKIKAKGFS